MAVSRAAVVHAWPWVVVALGAAFSQVAEFGHLKLQELRPDLSIGWAFALAGGAVVAEYSCAIPAERELHRSREVSLFHLQLLWNVCQITCNFFLLVGFGLQPNLWHLATYVLLAAAVVCAHLAEAL